jgi:hypothetical protein
MRKKTAKLTAAFIMLLTAFALWADDGMWLPHQMKSLDLKALGLEMDPGMLYKEDGTGLMSAIVHLGGGTGEFVSENGLILTNHHVAFRAIQSASTTENDYIEYGFLAADLSEEIPARGYIANVLTGYEDVTDIILENVKPGMNLKKRGEIIEKNIEALREKEEVEGSDIRIRIASMYGGNQYYLFRFKHLQDIRLSYAPPENLGSFGGDIDNWMWPRHTCDFTFLRAYVSPEGEGAAYHKDNVPYKPKSVVKISLDGLKEGDFNFIIGYPGRTYRNHMLKEVEAEITNMKQSIEYRKDLIDFLEKAGENNREVQIKYASRLSGLNNGLKNFQGKLEGFEKADIVSIKKSWEKQITEWINADRRRKSQYGDVVGEFNKTFEKLAAFEENTGRHPNLSTASTLMGQADMIYRAVVERAKPDEERSRGYKDSAWEGFKARIRQAETGYDFNTDKELMKWNLKQWFDQSAERLPKAIADAAASESEEKADALVENLYRNTILGDPEKRVEMTEMTLDELLNTNDPLVLLAAEMAEIRERFEKENEKENENRQKLAREKNEAKRNVLAALLDMHDGKFAPDANGTIRFTCGTVEGYYPRDAVFYKPFTTLKGVLEKETEEPPFIVPEKLKALYAEKDFGRYADPDYQDIVVNFLNTTNVTGGNSGSPTFNAKGEQVGIVFDMTYESVIGDYYVIPEFQRTISVDIRYVLFITEKFSGATHIIEELKL